MSGRIRSLQALRFVAAAGVVHAHAATIADSFATVGAPVWHQAGTVGVDIFFVISGFIIARVAFVEGRPSPGGFLRARWLRVVPIYWLASLGWFLLYPKGLGAANVVATLAFWPGAGERPAMPVLPLGWTLCFEMLFYLAAAAVLAAPRRSLAVAGLIGAWLAFAAARYFGPPLAVFSFFGNPIAAEFLAGVGIALIPGRRPALGAVALAAAVALFTATMNVAGINDGHRVLDASLSLPRLALFGLPAAALVFGALQLEPLFKSRIGAALAYLGDTSYALYLSHPLTFALVWKAASTFHLSGGAIVALGLGLAIPVGAAAHELVEKPLLRALRDSRPRPAAAPA